MQDHFQDFSKLNNLLSCFLQKKNNRVIASIVFCLLGLTFLIIQYRAQIFIYWDTASYAKRMVQLSSGDILGPDIIQPIGLPILGLPFFMSGLSPYFSFVIVNCMFFWLLIWCSGEIINKYNVPLVTLMMYMIISLEPIFSFTVAGGITDVPFCSLLALFLLLSSSPNSIRNSILLGSVVAFATYLRYPGFFLIGPLVILHAARNKSLKKSLLYLTVSMVSLIIILAPMIIRNFLSTGNPIPIDYSNIQEASMGVIAIKWILGFLSALKLIPFTWFDALVGNKITVLLFLPLSVLIIALMIYSAVIYRKNVLLLMSIVCFAAYTGAMIIMKVHLEIRYLIPSIFFFFFSLIGFLCVKFSMDKLTYFGMVLLLAHAMSSSLYMAYVGYNLKGIPNYNKIIEGYSISGDLPKKVFMDSKAWPLYSLFPQMNPSGIIDASKTENVFDFISLKDDVLFVAISERGKKPNYEPVETPWRHHVKSLYQKYPEKFTIRQDNAWILMLEKKGDKIASISGYSNLSRPIP